VGFVAINQEYGAFVASSHSPYGSRESIEDRLDLEVMRQGLGGVTQSFAPGHISGVLK